MTDSRHHDPVPPSPGGLDTPVRFVKGVGPKRAVLLEHLGITTVGEALRFFPRRYEDRRQVKRIGEARIGLRETVVGEIRSVRVCRARRRRVCEVVLEDGANRLTGVWFNFREPYVKQRFVIGRRFLFHGEIRWDGMRLVMAHPETEEAGAEGEESLHFGRIVPVYPLTEDLSQRQMRRVMHGIVERYAPLAGEELPAFLREKYHLPGIAECLGNVHFPGSGADPEALNEFRSPWHKRLIFEEFFFLEVWLMFRRRQRESIHRSERLKDPGRRLEPFLEHLPFRLTEGQETAFREIRSDLLSEQPMYRLLQGDVGSGKTVVMAMALLLVADNGFQSALMAPTEILARQHHQTLTRLFAGQSVRVELLVSALGAPQKRAVLDRTASGEAAVVVGTHALLQEGVEFRRLGLVAVDEQHRFGVSHRLSLRQKGDEPHTLVVTATPIPRTLAMTLYGDMDVSSIIGMPPGRKPVETRLIMDGERDELYRIIREELERGNQAFVVCPLVEESEALGLKAAGVMARELSQGPLAPFKVGLIHGRLKSAAKEAVMRSFQEGDTRVLVATTVVEVGVDVPRATVMVVEHAERFGLAQLHQLRGRVGRGGGAALCLLVPSAEAADEALERLRMLSSTSDGFELAEQDLQARGPGEFAGLRQSGAPDFLLANIIRHRRALEFARVEAQALIRGDASGKYELTRLLDIAKIRWEADIRYLAGG